MKLPVSQHTQSKRADLLLQQWDPLVPIGTRWIGYVPIYHGGKKSGKRKVRLGGGVVALRSRIEMVTARQ